ncbi:MAG: LysR family transcriptional regulator [Variovorax sp.]|nr:LysR family transcriptional regulator [Variovorax sp.]
MPEGLPSRHGAEELIDLNDLRVFAYVASLASFSLAADALNIHKSSVSRSIARLETLLGTPLIERTTRKVELTRRGVALKDNCVEILSRVSETIEYMTSFSSPSARHPGTRSSRTGRALPKQFATAS